MMLRQVAGAISRSATPMVLTAFGLVSCTAPTLIPAGSADAGASGACLKTRPRDFAWSGTIDRLKPFLLYR